MSESISDSLPEPTRCRSLASCLRALRYVLATTLPRSATEFHYYCCCSLLHHGPGWLALQYNFNHHMEAFATGNELLPCSPCNGSGRVPAASARSSILAGDHGNSARSRTGHYFFCRHYGVRATLPFFIPAPTLIGTLGAFIRIGGFIRSRAALFDIASPGPSQDSWSPYPRCLPDSRCRVPSWASRTRICSSASR